jgi:hypothetical protein
MAIYCRVPNIYVIGHVFRRLPVLNLRRIVPVGCRKRHHITVFIFGEDRFPGSHDSRIGKRAGNESPTCFSG